MKDIFAISFGFVGCIIVTALGGWDTALQTLLIFMAVDFVSGLVLAGVFKRSHKTEGGALSSRCCWRGIAKKVMQLLIVLTAQQIDIMIGSDFVRLAVIIAFLTGELISITENAGLMGIPIPPAISRALDVLNSKGGDRRDART